MENNLEYYEERLKNKQVKLEKIKMSARVQSRKQAQSSIIFRAEQEKAHVSKRRSPSVRENCPTVLCSQDVPKSEKSQGRVMGSVKFENISKKPTPPTRSSSEGRIVKESAFTVIIPDRRKRQQILNQAKREEDAYEAHKRSSRPTHIKMLPQKVGSKAEDPVMIEEARSRQQHLFSVFGPSKAAQKKLDSKAESRAEEGKKFEAIKSEARQKTLGINNNNNNSKNNAKETRADSKQLLREKRLEYLGL